jgi:uncharacterized protein
MTRTWIRTRRAVCVGAAVCLGTTTATVAGFVGTGVAWSAAAGSSGGCGTGSLKLSVQGRGSVTTAPNVLTLDLQVSASAGNPGTALESDESATTAVVAALTAGGLASKDIQTTDLSVQPNYAQTGTVVSGYQADTTIVAKIHQFSSVAPLISKAVAAGGTDTTIQSLSFSVTNPLGAQDRARRAAVHQAVGHAASMAAAAGERLGQLCSLKDESSTTSTGPVPVFGTATGRAANAGGPIEEGSQTVTAQVMLVYSLVPRRSRHH